MNQFGILIGTATLLLALLLPRPGAAANQTYSSCNALAESFLSTHAIYQNNHKALFDFLQSYLQQGKELLLQRQQQLEAQEKNLRAMRTQLEALKTLTVQGGSQQEAVDHYNGMLAESKALHEAFAQKTADYRLLVDEFNALVGIYNSAAEADPAEQGCGDYLPRLAQSPFAANQPFDRERALLLCGEETRAIAEYNRQRAAIEASACPELINSLPEFPRPRQTSLPSLPEPPAREETPAATP